MLDIERAERDANKVLQEHWLGQLPVDPFKIATRLEIDVYLAQLGREISGLIKKEPNVRTVIYIDADEVLVRQRFTCAHELGHYIENSERDIIGYVDKRGLDRSPSERYANAFAAALLMPGDLVQSMSSQGADLRTLARYFYVSEAAMSFRLSSIKNACRAS